MTSLPEENLSGTKTWDCPWEFVCTICMQCVCFNTATQAFTPKVITSENLSPQSLLISLSFTGSEQEGTIGLHPNVCVHECVYRKWHALCCAANTQSKRKCCPPAHPAALVFTYRYLLSSPLFPFFLSLSLSKLLEKLAEVFISQSNPYSRYPCQTDQGEGASGGSMFGLG